MFFCCLLLGNNVFLHSEFLPSKWRQDFTLTEKMKDFLFFNDKHGFRPLRGSDLFTGRRKKWQSSAFQYKNISEVLQTGVRFSSRPQFLLEKKTRRRIKRLKSPQNRRPKKKLNHREMNVTLLKTQRLPSGGEFWVSTRCDAVRTFTPLWCVFYTCRWISGILHEPAHKKDL